MEDHESTEETQLTEDQLQALERDVRAESPEEEPAGTLAVLLRWLGG
jgi:hypothetical protein